MFYYQLLKNYVNEFGLGHYFLVTTYLYSKFLSIFYSGT